ncbi:MAG: hypothetical protein ACPGXZ_00850 [Saprospiraceae bacterium]
MKSIYDKVVSFDEAIELQKAELFQENYIGAFYYRKGNGCAFFPAQIHNEKLLYSVVAFFTDNSLCIRILSFSFDKEKNRNVWFGTTGSISIEKFREDFVIAPFREKMRVRKIIHSIKESLKEFYLMCDDLELLYKFHEKELNKIREIRKTLANESTIN